MVKFRKAIKRDIENIFSIIEHGQAYLKEQGVAQWQDNYPNKETIEHDIENGYAYVVEEASELIGTVALSFDGEITYNKIFDGQWLSLYDDYCVIHRMAIHKAWRGSGISSFMMHSIISLCKDKGIQSIKVDTHRNNMPMQQYLEKKGFQYCGVIYLLDGDERLAYEKLLG